MSRVLDLREPEYRDRDAFLYALLGIVSYGAKLEAALRKAPAGPELAPCADWQVDAVLGLVVLWRKAKVQLDEWRDAACLPPANAEPAFTDADGTTWRR